MMLALIGLPLAGAGVALAIPSHRLRRGWLALAAAGHAGLTALAWLEPWPPAFSGWLALDPLGRIFLSLTSLLFLAASLYAVRYLGQAPHAKPSEENPDHPGWFSREAVFTACLLLFLSTMSLVCLSQHFGLLWVAVEATTLASAPLIYFHRQDRSLEATWKYLLLCSVGIAVALLGTFFLAMAAGGEETLPLVVSELAAQARQLQPSWLKAALLLFLVGYGTKMGLAPMHTWLPDAHSEAPSLVSALLSGALLNCAFLGILRLQQVCSAGGLGGFGQDAFVVFGLLSMAVAAIFILNQKDYKRMLAYSSVEHMGILMLGVGLSGAAAFGAMLHAVNHSLTKAALFLVAGNLLAAYASKSTLEVRGALQRLPVSGVLWVAGFLAITGAPPFGTFISELVILKAALDQGRFVVAGLYLAFLAVIFAGMSAIVMRMAQGRPAENLPRSGEAWLAVAPPAVLLLLTLGLGAGLPGFLNQALRQAAALFGGR